MFIDLEVKNIAEIGLKRLFSSSNRPNQHLAKADDAAS